MRAFLKSKSRIKHYSNIYKSYFKITSLKPPRTLTTMVEPQAKEESHYGVPDRFLKKNIPKNLINTIQRIEYILAYPDQHYDQDAVVAGWSKTVKTQANLIFIELTDGSSSRSLQIVIDSTLSNFEEVSKTRIATSYKIRGKLVKSPGKNQTIEMQVKDPVNDFVKIFGNTDAGVYPLGKQFQKPELLRDIAHLRPRTNLISSMSRIRNSLAMSTHLFFQSRGFYYIHTPIITASDCEGAGAMFQVTTLLPEKDKPATEIPVDPIKKSLDYKKDFFEKPAYLTVSGQLSVENYACALSNVYTFGPTFRAENSKTNRHLSEFWMIEPEIAFADMSDLMELAESYLKFNIKYILENNLDDLKFFEERVKKGLLDYLKNILNSKFVKVTYTEAIEILEKAIADGKVKFEFPVSWGIDLASEHERYLAEQVYKGPIIAYNYPKDIKAFYMRLNEDGKTVTSMDVLVPDVGEVIGGSVREERLELLDKRIEDFKLEKDSYWWYRDLRKYGTVPHAGFGLGFERLIMMCTGIENIRDVIPYPRYPGKAEF